MFHYINIKGHYFIILLELYTERRTDYIKMCKMFIVVCVFLNIH